MLNKHYFKRSERSMDTLTITLRCKETTVCSDDIKK